MPVYSTSGSSSLMTSRRLPSSRYAECPHVFIKTRSWWSRRFGSSFVRSDRREALARWQERLRFPEGPARQRRWDRTTMSLMSACGVNIPLISPYFERGARS